MEKVVLKSMVDFIMEEHATSNDFYESFLKCINYANLLSQQLSLGMFVPCDLEGNVLEEPTGVHEVIFNDSEYLKEYQEAKDRVLFKGLKFEDVQPSTTYNYYHIGWIKVFEANNQYKFFPCNGFKTVEDLTRLREVFLTPTAQKQLGL